MVTEIQADSGITNGIKDQAHQKDSRPRQEPGKTKGRKGSAKRPRKPNSQAVRRRGTKPYPVVVFEEALKIPQGIMQHASGNPVRRLTLLQLMDLNPSSQATRDLITNAGKYNLTIGNHGAEELKLTEKGRIVVDPKSSPRQQRQAAFDLAIAEIEPFKRLYDAYAGKPMPSLEVMQDKLEDLDPGDRKPCVDIFVGNANYVGLLKTIGGAKHLLSIEDALDELARTGASEEAASQRQTKESGTNGSITSPDSVDFEKTCFFIAPIGENKSDDPKAKEQRLHSDTILNQYVRRALEEQKLKVVRADEIAEPGMISKQIIEYIMRSRLVIADLSFNNPNVFYELCLRHVTGRPTVHIIRKGDKIPFDVGNFRTITIGLKDIHEAIAEIDTHRAEIANHVRQALTSGQSRDNPILTFYPRANLSLGEN
ncbi:MAG TPA: hypothetical protein VGG61_03560 [Gemmataceae bacterium]